MTFAFDFGGTLSKHPKELSTMMSCLKAGGHRVVVLSANLSGSVNEVRENLKAIGIDPDAFEVAAVIEDWNGTNKARFCEYHAVGVLVDDAKYNMEGVAKFSPLTARLQVL